MDRLNATIALSMLVACSVFSELRADSLPLPELAFSGSLPGQFTDNAFLTPNNRVGDLTVGPFFKATIAEHFTPFITLSAYASSNFDKFRRENTADDAKATLGTRLQIQTGDLKFGAYYEHVYVFDGIYKKTLFIADEINGFVQYKYTAPFGLLVTPSVNLAYRFADDRSVQRYLLTGKVDLEQPLTPTLSLVATGRLRYFAFTDGPNLGRQDLIASISGGFKQDLTKDISFSPTVGYERRYSNRETRRYNNLTIGASLDYAFNFPL
jgi:predicted porin